VAGGLDVAGVGTLILVLTLVSVFVAAAEFSIDAGSDARTTSNPRLPAP